MKCEKWYKNQPEPITKAKIATIFWDFAIQTNRKIKITRPDIMVRNYKRKICLLINMSVPKDKNISVKEYNKISKFEDLEIKAEKIGHLKITTVPVIVVALGMIEEETDKQGIWQCQSI